MSDGTCKNKPGFIVLWLVLNVIMFLVNNFWFFLQAIASASASAFLFVCFLWVKALGDYVWNIVRSGCKEVKGENHTNQPCEMKSRTTYETKSSANQEPV